jgi:hypothetical protein
MYYISGRYNRKYSIIPATIKMTLECKYMDFFDTAHGKDDELGETSAAQASSQSP